MKKLAILAAVTAMTAAAPASANHLLHLDTPYASRGECEAAVAHFNSDDRDDLLERFPSWFDSRGDVQSLLTRAFPCELNDADGQWYIKSELGAVLASEWYQGRH